MLAPPAFRHLLALGVVATALVGELLPFGSGASAQDVSPSRLPCTSVNQELNFSNYWLGPSFEGLELTAVLRSCGGGGRSNSIDYFYGDCTPQGGGCAVPLEIQV